MKGAVVDSCYYPNLALSAVTSANAPIKLSRIAVRDAKPEDAHILAEVLTSSFHKSSGFWSWTYPLFKLGIYEDLRSRLNYSSPFSSCLVASTYLKTPLGFQEQIIGTVELNLRSHYNWSNLGQQYPYISNLAVSKSYRRQGVAAKLLLRCEQIALEWGFQDISLHVLENNEQAQNLYLRGGFKLQKRERGFNNWLFSSPCRLFLRKKLKNS